MHVIMQVYMQMNKHIADKLLKGLVILDTKKWMGCKMETV